MFTCLLVDLSPNQITCLRLKIYTFYSLANGSHYLVRDCAYTSGNIRYRKVWTENLYGVTFTAADVSNVYHSYIHTDIAYILCLLTIYDAAGIAVAQLPV